MFRLTPRDHALIYRITAKTLDVLEGEFGLLAIGEDWLAEILEAARQEGREAFATQLLDRPRRDPPLVENIALKDRLALRVPEAAAASGLSQTVLYDLMRDGHLAYSKVGSRRLILLEDLKAFLMDHRVVGETEAPPV